MAKMKGLTCVITGATSGIGRATALSLGALGTNLILLGRNSDSGDAVIRRIRRMPGAGMAEFISTDLSDHDQVRKTAAHIAARHETLDLLINNAGARNDRYQQSPQGIELTFACNHLGHFLLTAGLLDRLRAARAARIITVASGSHSSATIDGVWELPAAHYDRRQAYARSKLANILFSLNLAERLKETRVVSNAYDPGGVASGFSRNNGLLSWARHLLAHGLRRELVSPGLAAAGIVHLAQAPELHGVRGRYFRRHDEIIPPTMNNESALSRELWNLSLRLTKLDERIGAMTWQIFQP